MDEPVVKGGRLEPAQVLRPRLKGSPTVPLVLFVPDDALVMRDDMGDASGGWPLVDLTTHRAGLRRLPVVPASRTAC